MKQNFEFEKLIKLSLANATWSKYNSGWKAFKDFESQNNFVCGWPISIEKIRSFTIWCIAEKKIASTTVKSYLSALNIAHALKGHDCKSFCSDKIIQLLLAGAENVKNTAAPAVSSRRAMTLSALKLIGHYVAKSQYSMFDKQVIWCICTTSFFTSVRIGEILSTKTLSFDPNSTLVWKNVKFMKDNEVLLFVPSTKTSKNRGEFIDMFPFENSSVCPVSSIKKLLNLALSKNLFDMEKPVFMFENGKCLTTQKLNCILKDLLKDIFTPGENSISCHSFRQGIPSVLNSHPKIFSHSEIKCWGRWISSSYFVYLKLQRDSRKLLFNKITQVL
jgi:hypothetical protein